MGEILGIGVTHFPGLMLPDAYMSSFLTRTLKSDRVPAEMKEPARWPEPLRQELAANQDGKAAAEHRRRLVGGFRKAREALDAFAPDFVLIWGDDQYENFREDGSRHSASLRSMRSTAARSGALAGPGRVTLGARTPARWSA
jgi:hypothetical protein